MGRVLQSLLIKTLTKVGGKMVNFLAMASILLLVEIPMSANLLKVNQMVKANLLGLMETSITVILFKVNLMAKANLSGLTEIFMKEIGLRIRSME